ncbi:hypothetical protein N6H18_02730 [Reichenbachiella agarivorans]|uniref:Uncharacterized protein n=1 Tax=Reichenbachiella agarivorans TaxID=2979464 RepID=A0ABY6CQV4_9BACT|nr:hypothetical protein [Reichenbachiella agarivorans]UXP32871.1 hypothetical protein N6H18_02730 [Reichenbachiella agarivorans]
MAEAACCNDCCFALGWVLVASIYEKSTPYPRQRGKSFELIGFDRNLSSILKKGKIKINIDPKDRKALQGFSVQIIDKTNG